MLSSRSTITCVVTLFALTLASPEATQASNDRAALGRPAVELGLGNPRAGEVVADSHGLAVEVPEPGTSVSASAERWDGSGGSLTVSADDAGVVYVSSDDTEDGGDGYWYVTDDREYIPLFRSTTAEDPCTDTAHGYLGGIAKGWRATMNWYWTGANPGSGTGAQFLDEIKNATGTMLRSTDSCGYADRVSATAAYQGTTTAGKVNISSSATCTTRDTTSAIGVGTLPENTVAYTCIWRRSDGYIVESDMKLNTGTFTWGRYRYFVDKSTSGLTQCRSAQATAGTGLDGSGNRLVVAEDLLTHERGHSFGLADLMQDAHVNLTMSGWQGGCTRRHTTLGKGDVIGLNGIY